MIVLIENVALRGKAVQSSQYGRGYAERAIDGNRNGAYFDGSCSHTDGETNPWWRVDLLNVYRVSSVVITNRGDDLSERINEAEIHIGNSLENNGNDNPRYVTLILPANLGHRGSFSITGLNDLSPSSNSILGVL